MEGEGGVSCAGSGGMHPPFTSAAKCFVKQIPNYDANTTPRVYACGKAVTRLCYTSGRSCMLDVGCRQVVSGRSKLLHRALSQPYPNDSGGVHTASFKLAGRAWNPTASQRSEALKLCTPREAFVCQGHDTSHSISVHV